MSICLSFGYCTAFNQFTASTKMYVENLSDKTTESDEKSAEQFSYFIHEIPLELLLHNQHYSGKYLMQFKFTSPSFWPSPNTPPPDIA
ncbi:MAG: hypothetical protein EOO07_06860 [Chitinophagaceae bacterium]|nr:MAG: hypothetical protein EOO07_06860 [Chitinophagaceae bacterium]